MSNTSIAIIEDEPLISDEIALHLQTLGYNVSGRYYDPEDALRGLTTSPPALALVDVNLGGTMDGIDLIMKLKPAFPFVFLTSYGDEQTIGRAKTAHPAGYILKPFDERNIRSAVAIALHNEQHKTVSATSLPEDIFIKDKDQLVKVNCHDILWIEAYDNYTYIKTIDQKYLICSTLKKVCEKIERPFLQRIHRSYLINMEKISGISEAHVIINNFKLPIG